MNPSPTSAKRSALPLAAFVRKLTLSHKGRGKCGAPSCRKLDVAKGVKPCRESTSPLVGEDRKSPRAEGDWLDELGEGFNPLTKTHYCCIMFVQASCIFLSSSALGIG